MSDHYHALLEERRDNPCDQGAILDASGRYLADAQDPAPERPHGIWDANRDAREPVKE